MGHFAYADHRYWLPETSRIFQLPPLDLHTVGETILKEKDKKVTVSYHFGDPTHVQEMKMGPAFFIFYFADQITVHLVFRSLVSAFIENYKIQIKFPLQIPNEASQLMSEITSALVLRDRNSPLERVTPKSHWVESAIFSILGPPRSSQSSSSSEHFDYDRYHTFDSQKHAILNAFLGEYLRKLIQNENWEKIERFYDALFSSETGAKAIDTDLKLCIPKDLIEPFHDYIPIYILNHLLYAFLSSPSEDLETEFRNFILLYSDRDDFRDYRIKKLKLEIGSSYEISEHITALTKRSPLELQQAAANLYQRSIEALEKNISTPAKVAPSQTEVFLSETEDAFPETASQETVSKSKEVTWAESPTIHFFETTDAPQNLLHPVKRDRGKRGLLEWWEAGAPTSPILAHPSQPLPRSRKVPRRVHISPQHKDC